MGSDEMAGVEGQMEGLGVAEPFKPWNVHVEGTPQPPADAERREVADAVRATCSDDDPEILSALQLICTVFETSSAMVTLIRSDPDSPDGTISDAPYTYGPMFKAGIYKGNSPAAWALLPESAKVLVIEDTTKDSRMRKDFAGYVKFYATAPLIGSTGHRLGVLSVLAQQPRRFDASRAAVLANMAELIVRRLEYNWAMQQSAAVKSRLMRSLKAYQTPMLFVDTSPPQWRVLHLTSAAAAQIGLTWDRKPFAFWDVLKSTSGDDASAEASLLEAAESGDDFTIADLSLGNSDGSVTFSLTLWPAAGDALDDDQPLVGTPSHLPEAPEACRNYFFAQVHDIRKHTRPRSQRTSTESSMSSFGSIKDGRPTFIPLQGLELGHLLGQGRCGRVYRGVYQGSPVAIRILDSLADVKMAEDNIPLEVACSTGPSPHPHLLNTSAYAFVDRSPGQSPQPAENPNRTDAATRGAAREAAPASPTGLGQRCWLISELCDRGTLQEAILKGCFCAVPGLWDGGINLGYILYMASGIASALAYLHERDVLHARLTAANVLLAHAPASPHGYAPKVSDYGLVRSSEGQGRGPDERWLNIAYLAPELLLGGPNTKEANVYAFGVVLWEVVTSSPAWANMDHHSIMRDVTRNHRSLQIPQSAPPPLAQLLGSCMAYEPSARPTAADIVAQLESMAAA